MANSPAHLDALPTELRLRAIEARVRGVPATFLAPESEAETDSNADRDVPLWQRAAALRTKLDEAANTSPPLRQFIDNYERYAPLLRTLPGDDEVGPEADVLSPDAKAALVLESRADIVAAEKGLREIDVYNRRGVTGADGLEELVNLKPALVAGTQRVAARHKSLEEARGDVAALVGRYNEFTSTVSEMFLALHDQLTHLEEAVTRAERAKRDAQKFRY